MAQILLSSELLGYIFLRLLNLIHFPSCKSGIGKGDKCREEQPSVPRYKVVVVGDGFVGKTCLLHTQAHGDFPKGYAPTVFENYILPLPASGVQSSPVELSLWDTAGQEDYDRLRPLSYPGASVFLLCYAVDNLVSLRNLSERWIPEVRHHSPRTPILLVGLKGDLRGDPRVDRPMVRMEDVLDLADRSGVTGHLECSAWSRQGLDQVFSQAGHIAYKEAHSKHWVRKKGECRVL
ncbi:P-loop containing nucleoside triphosphate hydrolase protein [Piptocephalis cylindrospora]|uniref:P-loop containing nucleoside triphosphate hydrolase protein n=1 Tax=Piptocephalis cylindrospora TaxID=1907219 RepID=A0A4V1IXY7_9FUNG|nr:P-loop containing nucleoside triphosphate hydrolase protein [Piptocephalis cylindrospora]|eukprot:RKP12699.1 P-loop containing nucleoside triphosphate hydrolase protein [Piptocephalis cylindrospora]